MTLRSTLKLDPSKLISKPIYPYLGKGRVTGNIILFIKKRTGMLVKGGNSNSLALVGAYSTNWPEESFNSLSKGESVTITEV